MFIMQIPYMSLKDILATGQGLDWKYLGEERYLVGNGKSCVIVSQQKDRFVLKCTDSEFYDVWYNYFDVMTDYSDEIYHINGGESDPLYMSSRKCKGTRVLNRELWDVLVEAILSDGVSQDKARELSEKFRKEFSKGRKVTDGGVQTTWHPYPSERDMIVGFPESSREAQRNEKFAKIYEFALEYRSARNWPGVSLVDAVKMALEMCDLTSKSLWARIMFYGFRGLDVYPESEALSDYLWNEYGDADVEVIREWYIDRYAGKRGLMLQYMLADYNRFHEKEVVMWG